MPEAKARRRNALLTASATLAGVFVADLLTPPGISWGMAYAVVVLLAWAGHRRFEVPVFASLSSVLIVAGFLAATHPEELRRTSLVNRGLAVAVVWVVAWLALTSRRALSAASESAARLQAVFTTAVDAIVTIDTAGTIVDCNVATEKLFGWSRGEMTGRNVALLMPSPYHEEHDGYLARYRATGERRIIGIGREVAARRKDGSVFPIDLAVSEFQLNGETFYTGIIHDVTERREAARSLEKSNRALEERNRELQNIVYATSHDLRSPLVNIQGFSQELQRSCAAIRDRLDHPDPDALADARRIAGEEVEEALRFITTSAAKMDSLLSGLLRLSRLGRAALRMETLDMNELVAQAARSLEFQVQRLGARVEIGPLPTCRGDAVQIGQVFSNILDNALKYAHPERPPTIRVSGESRDSTSVYEIADNGIGIASGHQARIFEVFHRLDTTRTEGEGLGLTIAQRILERHEGEIRVESEPGRGSTFIVTLPAAESRS